MHINGGNDWSRLQLLRSILRHASTATSAPLQFELNDADVVAAALRTEEVRRELMAFDDPSAVCHAFDRLLACIVEIEHFAAPRFVEREATARKEIKETEATLDVGGLADRLAAWLAQLRVSLGMVHPKAMEAVALRAEGYDNRDVAERLDLGLRLSRRIAQDTIAALRSAQAKG